MQGVGNTATSYIAPTSTNATKNVTYNAVIQPGRSFLQQGGYQIVGWCLSVGIGAFAGLLIGFIYRCINDQ